MILDTHTFLWFINGDDQLSKTAKALIEDEENSLYLSMASGWEMAIKMSRGVLKAEPRLSDKPLDELLNRQRADNGIIILPITIDHVLKVKELPYPAPSGHKDPFDRLIIAQSLVGDMPIIGVDSEFDQYGVKRLW